MTASRCDAMGRGRQWPEEAVNFATFSSRQATRMCGALDPRILPVRDELELSKIDCVRQQILGIFSYKKFLTLMAIRH